MKSVEFELARLCATTALVSMLFISTLSQAKEPVLPIICTEGGSASVIITDVGLYGGYYVDMLMNNEIVSAYCGVGDCALLYNYGISNISAKVELSYDYMEEYENTKTCTITDIELTPDDMI